MRELPGDGKDSVAALCRLVVGRGAAAAAECAWPAIGPMLLNLEAGRPCSRSILCARTPARSRPCTCSMLRAVDLAQASWTRRRHAARRSVSAPRYGCGRESASRKT
jgi:hypothetical protein